MESPLKKKIKININPGFQKSCSSLSPETLYLIVVEPQKERKTKRNNVVKNNVKMTNFEKAYGKIEKTIVEETNALTEKLLQINKELRDLKIPVRVYAKTTDNLTNFEKDSQLYFTHTVNHSINISSEF